MKIHGMGPNKSQISLYTSEELVKVFLIQVYETGFESASVTFHIYDEDIARKTKVIYAQLMSNPLVTDCYNFLAICYKYEDFISALDLTFRSQIVNWCAAKLPYGADAYYNQEELQQILKDNYAIKAVYVTTGTEEIYCIGSLTSVFLTVLNHQADEDIKQLFCKLLSHQCLTYTDAVFALQALSHNKSQCLNYYAATLLMFLKVNSNYNNTILEVRNAYGL